MIHHHTRKVATHHLHHHGRVFAILALIIGVANGAFWTMFPLILHYILGSVSQVGFYHAMIACVSFVTSLCSAVLFSRFSKVGIMHVSFGIIIASFILMTVANTIWHLGLFDILRAICLMIIGISLSLFVRDFAGKTSLAKDEGRYYLFANMGWFVGPVLGGVCMQFLGKESVFLLAAFLYSCAFFLFVHQHLVKKHPHLHHGKHFEPVHELLRNLWEFVKNREFRIVFLIALGLNFWWAVFYIYGPLRIAAMDFSSTVVGAVMSASILPLILLEYGIGKRGDIVGVKRYIICGFCMLAAFVLSFFFLEQWPLILILSFVLVNIGAAFIEPLHGVYFFKAVAKKDCARFFGIYNTADPIANVFGPLLMSSMIVWGGVTYAWMGVATILFGFAITAFLIGEKY